jgi:hypothetical protein
VDVSWYSVGSLPYEARRIKWRRDCSTRASPKRSDAIVGLPCDPQSYRANGRRIVADKRRSATFRPIVLFSLCQNPHRRWGTYGDTYGSARHATAREMFRLGAGFLALAAGRPRSEPACSAVLWGYTCPIFLIVQQFFSDSENWPEDMRPATIHSQHV